MELEHVPAETAEVSPDDLCMSPGVQEAIELYEMAMTQYTAATAAYQPAVAVMSSTSTGGWR